MWDIAEGLLEIFGDILLQFVLEAEGEFVTAGMWLFGKNGAT